MRRAVGANVGSVAWLAMLPFVLAAQRPGTDARWTTRTPDHFVLTGLLDARGLAEASGAAPSIINPGVFWTIGDSGNPPELLAIDTTGVLRARFGLLNVANVDWEAVSVGPCPRGTCVYIGDVGDNAERRTEVAIHRVVEPLIRDSNRASLAGVETLRVRYPQRPHDVEAMAVRSDGTVLLVTKGRSGGVLLYDIGAQSWGSRTPVTARRVDSLPITANGSMGRLVTDMALRADGARLAVRTYRDVYIFDSSRRGVFTPIVACDIFGREPQGEGIAWLPDGRLLLVSERGFFQRGPVNTMTCI